MKPIVFIQRDGYGRVTAAAFRLELLPPGPWSFRHFSTTKQLAVAMLQTGSRKTLIDAAWRMAVRADAVEPSKPFRYGDPLDVQTVEYARQEAFQLDFYIGQLVNDPKSQFYIHG